MLDDTGYSSPDVTVFYNDLCLTSHASSKFWYTTLTSRYFGRIIINSSLPVPCDHKAIKKQKKSKNLCEMHCSILYGPISSYLC